VRTSGRKASPFAGLGLALLPNGDTLDLVERSPRADHLETTIREIAQQLQELPVTPHVRELRAKAVTYGRVIGNWSTYAPTAPQVQAMLECVAELEEKVGEAKREANRDVSKVTRRQSEPIPHEKTSKKPGPPPLPSGLPPALTWNASVPETGVRARSSTRPPSRNEAPTRPPPALSTPGGSTVPPVSAPRSIDTPTPALLRSRRSR
jgi:hypothetical protein